MKIENTNQGIGGLDPSTDYSSRCQTNAKYSFGCVEGSDVRTVAETVLTWAIKDNKLLELQELIDEIKSQITEKYTPRISDYDNET